MFEVKRELSRTNLLFISFAAIFGSGWLFAPFYAAQLAGPASLLAWCLGALISAVIGITMAEVIALHPKTGGVTGVAAMTHGEVLAFLVTVFNVLVYIILPALEVRAVLQYSAAYFPKFANPDGAVSFQGTCFAFALLSLITLVNLYGARVTAYLSSITVIFKILTPILISAAILIAVSYTPVQSFSPWKGFFPIPWEQVFHAIATSGIIFSFNGFNQATVFAGEAKNPQRTVPFAILGSLLVSGSLYLLVQYVFLVSVPEIYLQNGWSHLSFPGDQGPFAGIAGLLGLHWLLAVIYADSVISPMGTAFSYASSAPRIFYAFSEANHVFPSLRKLNRHGVPYLGILLTFVLELIAFVLLPNLKAMIAILVSAFVLNYTVAPVSLLKLRKLFPDLERPFRVPLAPFFSYLSLFISNLMVFSCGWTAVRNLILTGILPGMIYIAFAARKGSKVLQLIQGCEWFLIQLGGIGALCYWKEFQHPPFLWLAFGIALLSIFVLWISQVRSLSAK